VCWRGDSAVGREVSEVALAKMRTGEGDKSHIILRRGILDRGGFFCLKVKIILLVEKVLSMTTRTTG